jgi:hypothetical protein
MRNQPAFRLNRQALIAAIISAAFPIVSHAAAGRVEFAIGNVTASAADGRERSLAKGGEINTGDTIQTTDGRTQIKFTDGGYMSLQPNTQFKVDDYAYDGKADGSEKGFFKLVKGGLRAITGAIGHTNKTTYRINTPVATIGIRGTELTGEYTEEGDNKKLIVHVSGGSVYLQNSGGNLVLFQGQSGIVTNENEEPDYTDEESLITAEGPDGSPQKHNEEQQQELAQSLIFQQAEQYDGDGVSESLGVGGSSSSDLTDVLAAYTNANAEGWYDLDYTGTITGIPNTGSGPAGYTNVQLAQGSNLQVFFGNYTITANLFVQATYSGSQYTTYFNPSGSLSGQGFVFNPFTAPGGSGELCTGSCTINVTNGLFLGPTAQNASINYTIPSNSNLIGGGSITGTAGFNSPTVPAPGAVTNRL